MASYYVTAEQPTDLNRNTEWFTYPGVWTTYILILFFSWLLVLSIFGCSPGMAWTIVNLSHFAVIPHSPLSFFMINWTYLSFVDAFIVFPVILFHSSCKLSYIMVIHPFLFLLLSLMAVDMFCTSLICFTPSCCVIQKYTFLFQVTYHFFHWKKGTPFPDDQGIYNALTWWEQIDHGKQLTRNRKFLTVVPVVL
ncbi:hypothetical protein RHSIM_Rhsim01G0175000 [Rhododendron simsii]|uniref:Uncharacterized protein n=1 Tax=Rhododendron simsii TaxID=118357 RepID=A0A834LXJ7_RHOSS|nr:hypothetical protein RHSIM_Rhsim01G0175000 [Rhododendron simsii]